MTAVTGRVEQLQPTLRAITDRHSGRCTWSLIDLDTGERIGHDENAVMAPASLIKVPILVALYRAAENGRLRLDDRVRYDEREWRQARRREGNPRGDDRSNAGPEPGQGDPEPGYDRRLGPREAGPRLAASGIPAARTAATPGASRWSRMATRCRSPRTSS